MIRGGWDPFDKLERLPFPTVALIDGFCMGGGLELALACRHRVAVEDPRTRMALPEVMLGIWPLMGGAMRLPRVVAVTVTVTGEPVAAASEAPDRVAAGRIPQIYVHNATNDFAAVSPPWTTIQPRGTAGIKIGRAHV